MKKFILAFALLLGLYVPASAQHQTPSGPLDDIKEFVSIYACGPFSKFKPDVIDEIGFVPVLSSRVDHEKGSYIYTIFFSKTVNLTLLTLADKFGNICVLNAITGLQPIDPYFKDSFVDNKPEKNL